MMGNAVQRVFGCLIAAIVTTHSVAALASETEGPTTVTPSSLVSDWRHPVKEAVHSLAIDPDGRKMAALGSSVWIREKTTWRAIPLPDALKTPEGERDELRIFFGRDNQPRIMGTRFAAKGPKPHYLRFRHGAWKRWPSELAAFSRRPHAAIYGVLGWDDPEVLCKVGLFCLIKQRRGWSKVPLPIEPPRRARRIDLAAGGAYALLDDRLLRLGKKRWFAVGPTGPWKGSPHAAWLDAERAWVSVPDESALYVLERSKTDAKWQRVSTPAGAPYGVWSSQAGTLWVAGSKGAAYFDGKTWVRIVDRGESLREVIGLGDEIVFAGPSGLYQARRAK